MLRTESGCTIANPPDTDPALDGTMWSGMSHGRTEKLFGASALFNHFNKTWFKLLDGRNVVREDTHFTGFSWQVDLDAAHGLAAFEGSTGPPYWCKTIHIRRLVDRLVVNVSRRIDYGDTGSDVPDGEVQE